MELNPRLKQLPVPQRASEIRRTLRHELAHLVAYVRAGRRRIKPHGEEWKQACKDLGIAVVLRRGFHETSTRPAKERNPRSPANSRACRVKNSALSMESSTPSEPSGSFAPQGGTWEMGYGLKSGFI